MKTCDYTYYDYNQGGLNQTCSDLLDQFMLLKAKIQPYDLFGKCYFFNPSSEPQLYSSADENADLKERVLTVYQKANFLYRNRADYEKLAAEIPCGTYDAPLLAYFNKDSVKKSLNIDENSSKFELCGKINYTMSKEATFSIYQDLTTANKYRILKYSGDSDGVLPTIGTQNWIKELNLDTKEEWRAFKIAGQVAGYVQVYDKNFTFATIHGAGHMAPQWKRQQTYHTIFNWINNMPL